MHERLRGYPVVIEIPVAWGDMDAFQHVNNVVYFRYFESARVAYMAKAGLFPQAQGGGVGVILGAIQCAFKFPLTYPDTVWAGARVTAVGEDRITMHHIVVSQRHGRVAAEGEGVLVAYDYRALRKAVVPDELRRRIAELEEQAAV
jgi:acyl-CoA thioester hydrolase